VDKPLVFVVVQGGDLDAAAFGHGTYAQFVMVHSISSGIAFMLVKKVLYLKLA
jgi:hypothetical protein